MKKTTKRALLLSFASMFLCFTMLLGTTYAWFTDSVESGVNQIVAGSLDVELYNGLDNKAAKVNTNTKLFELEAPNVWEPGAMVYENLTVANEGDLALKYRLNVTVKQVNESNINLAEALKVAVVDGGIEKQTRDNLKTLDSYIPLESFFVNAELNAGETKTYGIVIWWEPTDSDNDYNMNKEGDEALKLNIGVDLFATQLEAESDSFGTDYDSDAALIISGEYVAYEDVKNNIVVNKGETATIKLKDGTVEGTLTNNGTVTITDGTIEVEGGNALYFGISFTAVASCS